MEITLESIGALIVILIGVGTIIGILLHYERRHTKLESRVENIEKNIGEVKELGDVLKSIIFLSKNPAVIELVKQIHPPDEKRNPYDPQEKDRLLSRYQNGTLDLDGARRLQEILNEDMAQLGNNIGAAIAIALLLIGLAALIAYLLSRRG